MARQIREEGRLPASKTERGKHMTDFLAWTDAHWFEILVLFMLIAISHTLGRIRIGVQNLNILTENIEIRRRRMD
jgi:hypothetical protein